MNARITTVFRRAALSLAAASIVGVGAVAAAPAATADTPGICTAHKANTATWANCHSKDRKAHWARLTTTCSIPGLGNRETTTQWKLVPARGDLTISGNCRFKAVRANVTWRPY